MIKTTLLISKMLIGSFILWHGQAFPSLLLLNTLSKKEIAHDTIKKEWDQKKYQFELQAGDLLFQDGDCGSFCEAIEKVNTGYRGSKFTHVGMVVPSEANELVVIEATQKGVVETPLASFFDRSFDKNNNSKVAVGRLKNDFKHLIPKAIEEAKTKLDKAYDAVFDIANDQYYCSELIYFSFKHANNNKAIFELQKMTFKDPKTFKTFPVWEAYFKALNKPIPEGEWGLNPMGMSTSNKIDILHFYGKPEGYKGP